MKNKGSQQLDKPKPNCKPSHGVEWFGDKLSALFLQALDPKKYDYPKMLGKCSLNDLEEQFAEVMAGYRAKFEGDEGDDELTSTLLADRVDTLERKLRALESRLAKKGGK